MPGANPPIDAEQADREPQFTMTALELGGRAPEVRIGEARDCPTLPEASTFRYVVFYDAGGRRFRGYLWADDPPPASTESVTICDRGAGIG